ncbi:MAG: hypothetical protein IJ170_09310 [Ruminococcus sp.]|nr:hypothetical protein [Ruminococcus sp.]
MKFIVEPAYTDVYAYCYGCSCNGEGGNCNCRGGSTGHTDTNVANS